MYSLLSFTLEPILDAKMTPERSHAFQHAGAGLLSSQPSLAHLLPSQYTLALPHENVWPSWTLFSVCLTAECLSLEMMTPTSLNQRNCKHSGCASGFLPQ